MDYYKNKFFNQYIDCANVYVNRVYESYSNRLTLTELLDIQQADDVVSCHLGLKRLSTIDTNYISIISGILGLSGKFERTAENITVSEYWGLIKIKELDFSDAGIIYKEINRHALLTDLKPSFHPQYLYVMQYLQVLGFAVPYLGTSVEELVRKGWVELI